MTTASVSALGPGLASRMSMEQLQAAYLLYSSINHVATNVNAMSLAATRQTFMNHLKSIVRMPHGGAAGGGSQQTGFEMELVSSTGANALFAGWPNYQSSHAGHRQSWELRSMEDLLLLKLHEKPAGWGAMMGKPIPMAPGRTSHVGLLLCAPPFTATWVQRHDGTTSLCVRFPLVLWTEADAVILPPDDAEGVPFYVDPPLSPGWHRDMFKTWGRRVAGELLMRGFPLSAPARAHLPQEYASDGESVASIAESSQSV